MAADPQRVQAIFLAAADCASPAERAALLAQECGDDAELRRRVEALLQAHDHPLSFLEAAAANLDFTAEAGTAAVGAQIGPYKLLQMIGEGGFGVVYMAEQLEPVRRKVALKVIKPGMDTRQVIARFEAERQALAVMDHPNIAKVLDAGATGEGTRDQGPGASAEILAPGSRLLAPAASGRPYFVMELVRGIPITQYCDENQLPIRERLELFATVCQAIQHAHTKGIIHRDVKPTNVMVTRQDGQPVVKVIDFGVAKAMGQQLTEKTLFTEFAQMIGTPLYMSPEQAELSSVDIDTRSDIYSLGVLLYELLTGTTPVSKEQLKQAAFDEIRRIIREDEPQKPSTRISSAEAAPSIAAQRHTEPAKLARLVRGELDWIVMKALEKDRNRRYETANGLAMDVQRYLHDEHVLACPPSAAYRFRKFARRNRMVLTTAAVVMLALVAGAAIAGWQAVRATKAQKLAQERLENETKAREEATANLQKAREAGEQFFSEISENAILDEPGLQPLRQQLLEAAVAYYEGLIPRSVNDPKVQVDVILARLRLAQVYHQVGIHDQYVATLDEALDLVEKFIQENPTASDLHLRLAGFWHGGRTLDVQRKWDSQQALKTLRRGAACWERLVQRYPEAIGFQSDLSKFYDLRGNLEWEMEGNKEERLRNRKKLCELRENIVRATPGVYENIAELGHAYIYLGRALEDTNAEEAESLFRQAIAIQKDAPNLSSYQHFRANAHNQLGRFLRDQGRGEEALPCLLEAIAINERLAEQFPHVSVYRTRSEQLTRVVENLRRSLGKNSEAPPANPQRQQALGLLKHLEPDDAPAILYAAARLQKKTGEDQLAAKELQKAEQSFRTAITLFEVLTELFPQTEYYWYHLGQVHNQLGQSDQAVGAFTKAVELKPDYWEAWHLRGWTHIRLGQWDQAVAGYTKAIDLKPDFVDARYGRGLAHAQLGQWAKAVTDQTKAIELKPDHWEAWHHRGFAHTQLGQWDKAVADYTKAVELLPSQPWSWCRRGEAYSALKQWDQAIADFAKAIELGATTAEVWQSKAAAHASLQQWDQARGDYAKAIRMNPGCLSGAVERFKAAGRDQEADKLIRQAVVDAERLTVEFPQKETHWYHLGLVHAQLGHWDQAVADYTKAIELKPDYWEAWNNRGWAHANLAQWEQVVASFSKAIELKSDFGDLWHMRGWAHANLGQWDKAVADQTKALELMPKHSGTWYRRAQAYSALKQWDQAIADYAQAIELGATDADVWQSKAAAHASLEQWDQALADYAKAIELNVNCLSGIVARLNAAGRGQEAAKLAGHAQAHAEKLTADSPKAADYWYHVGLAQISLQRLDQAVACCTKAIELKPDYWEAWYDRGLAHMHLGKWDQAVSDFSKAIELKPDFWQAWHNRGGARNGLEQWDQALADQTKASELKPDYWGIWQARGVLHAQLRQWDQAIADHTKAIELKADYAEAWHARGWAHANLGQWDKAVADQTKAVEFGPKNWWFWYRRAQAYSALKQWEQAIPDYAQAIELGATETDVWLSKAAAHAQLNQPDQAIAELKQAIAKGFRDAQYLRNREDLAALREREDFKRLILELEAKNK